MVKRKRVLLKTFLWPGWGHLLLGKRKKGWALWWITMIGLLVTAQGITMWLVKEYIPPPAEEVEISDSGMIEEAFMEKEKVEEVTPLKGLILPLSITIGGLGILTWVGIYAYKDTLRLLKSKESR